MELYHSLDVHLDSPFHVFEFRIYIHLPIQNMCLSRHVRVSIFRSVQDSAVKNVLAGIVQYCTDQIKSNQLNYMIIKLRKNGDLVDHFAGAFL